MSDRRNKKDKTLEMFKVFTGLALHDLRNKSFTVEGYTRLALKETDAEKSKGHLRKALSANSQTEKILNLMNGYLRFDLEKLRDVSVAKSFEEASLAFPELRGRKIEIINDCQGLMVLADNSMLTHIFFSFIDNSLKHGGKELKKISLSFEISFEETEVESRLKIIYRDDGVGIPPGKSKMIFRRDNQGQDHGLFLVKSIIDILDWEIEAAETTEQGVQLIISMHPHNEESQKNYRLNKANF